MAYSAEQKAMAVAILKRYGGLTQQAVADVREALDAPGLSKSTLHGWLPDSVRSADRTEPNRTLKKETGVAVPPEVQQAAEEALDDVFEAVARRYLAHALQESVMEDVKGKDAVIAAATAVDKMRLLRELPTEIVGILPELVDALHRAGLSAPAIFHRMLQEAHERAESRTHNERG